MQSSKHRAPISKNWLDWRCGFRGSACKGAYKADAFECNWGRDVLKVVEKVVEGYTVDLRFGVTSSMSGISRIYNGN